MGIQLGSAYGKVIIDATGVRRGVGEATTSLQALQNVGLHVAGALQGLGAGLTAGITLPLAMAGKKAFDVFREFEQSLNILEVVSGATEEEMKQLSDQARALGADLTLPGTSAADAANAMAELAKAGLDVNDILDASRGVLQLSVAGQIENARAAEITANALNAFHLEGSEAVRVADLLAAAALASSAEVSELADSLQMSAAVAAMSGMEINELVTALGLMANAGIQGSDAGTSVKQMLLQLQTPSNKAKDLMRDLGIEIYDAAGNMKSMRELIKVFSTQLRGLTQEERNHALGVIFGSDAVRAANIVLMQGVDVYDQMAESVNKSGAAAGLASKMMEGLTGEIDNIKSAFETASISAIEPFKDDLKTMLHFVAMALNAFSALPEPVRKMIVVFLVLLAALGPLLIILGTLLGAVINISLAMQMFGITVPMVSAAITGTLIPAIGSLLAILAPIIIILLAVLFYLGILAIMWKTNFLGMRDNVMTFVKIIKALWGAFTAFLRGDTEGAIAFLKEAFDAFAERINQIFEGIFGITNAWGRFMEFMKDALGRVVTYISDVFSKTDWSQLGKYITFGIANGMLFGIPGLILAASQAVKAVLDTFDTQLGMKSPSKVMEKRGLWSALGYMSGWNKSMNSNDVAGMMSKPLLNTSSQQQTIVQNFSSGLTVNQARGMIAENNEQLVNTIIGALGGA